MNAIELRSRMIEILESAKLTSREYATIQVQDLGREGIAIDDEDEDEPVGGDDE